MSVVCDKGKGRPLGELKATFSIALKVLQRSKTIMSYEQSQCVLLALCVSALGRGLTETVLGLGQRRGGGGLQRGMGSPPPTAPQTVEHPSGSHIGWRRPPWAGVKQPILILPPLFGDPRGRRADVAFPALFGACEKAGVRHPLLILSPFVWGWALRKPQNCCCVGCLVTLEGFSHFHFFRNPFVAPRMGLGGHLVTIRVLEHPWGPTQWPLGPCSPSHGPPKSFKIAVCRWFNGIWGVHKLLKQFSTLYRSNMENFANFFDIVTTYNDEICYLKHVLDLFVCFSPYWGGGGGTKGSRAHNLLMLFSSLGSSKMEISETDFFHTLTMQNDQTS